MSAREWREQPSTEAAAAVALPPVSPRHSTVWATTGLLGAWAVLAAFSLSAAVSSSRAADDAHRAAVVSEQFELVHEGLLAQEDAADAVVTGGDDALAAYSDAEALTRAGLIELRGIPGGSQEGDRWLAMHARYGQAVLELFQVAASAPEQAEAHEDSEVDPFYDPLEATLREQAHQHHDQAFAALVSMGRSQQVHVLATPVVFAGGLVALLAATAAFRRSRRDLAAVAAENGRQALHDPLTGLPNRVLLHRRCRQALEGSSEAERPPTGVMLLDLDGFKQVNDRFGHHSGDLVLQAVADRLRSAVRPTDTVARLGGDEFAILLPVIDDRDAALAVARSVQAVLTPPVVVDGVSLSVSASLGVALSRGQSDTMEALLRDADTAMYLAKDGGHGISVHDGPPAAAPLQGARPTASPLFAPGP
jgi:diguanylate cyclase (GGDEF)-like protein